MDICAVILCGGQSTRMGTNKSLLEINNQKVIDILVEELKQITDSTILIANDKAPYEYLNLPIYKDRYLDSGPLAGIEAAMHHVESKSYLFAACDMPFINKDIYKYLFQFLGDVDAVVPKYEGRVHPLASIYQRTCLPIIQEKLEEGDFRVRSFYDEINIKYVEDFDSFDSFDVKKHFFNMNNPTQYKEAKDLASKYED